MCVVVSSSFIKQDIDSVCRLHADVKEGMFPPPFRDHAVISHHGESRTHTSCSSQWRGSVCVRGSACCDCEPHGKEFRDVILKVKHKLSTVSLFTCSWEHFRNCWLGSRIWNRLVWATDIFREWVFQSWASHRWGFREVFGSSWLYEGWRLLFLQAEASCRCRVIW